MRRKSHVRFGGGRLEKEQQSCYLASRLPNYKAAVQGFPVLPAYILTQEEADAIRVEGKVVMDEPF